MGKSDHSALPRLLSQQLGSRAAALSSQRPSAGALGAVVTQLRPKVWNSVQEKMDENPLCRARNYRAEQISRHSGILWPLLVSDSCWAILKSRGDSGEPLQGEKPVDDADRC